MAYLNHDKITRREAVLMARAQHRRLMKRILDNDQSANADINRYNRDYWLKIAAHLKGVPPVAVKAVIMSNVEFVMGVRNKLVALTRNEASALVFDSVADAQEWLVAHRGAGYGFSGAGFNVVVKEA